MDPLKEAFRKIKEDILLLKNDISSLRFEINDLKKIKSNPSLGSKIIPPSADKVIQTDNSAIPVKYDTYSDRQTDIQTDNNKKHPLEPLYTNNYTSSIGNDGVQTDRQTIRQTVRHLDIEDNMSSSPVVSDLGNDVASQFEKANNILSSLDDIKRNIRLKFKALTPQEMLIFSTLYELENKGILDINYFILAKTLSLTESSIRDYINKLIKKGIPIDKFKQNNKKVILKISDNLKNIAPLSTILKLRSI